ncbi:AAA-ATPase At2g46620 [Malania oleifera]|uniref:AAA-ATPase At2g46620 n=1 Tax=Malania oleifera TaxID=397392 RepID=UPI0025ADB744|nr:AAA-ATPase At2g46620 [Malania oleifera]
MVCFDLLNCFLICKSKIMILNHAFLVVIYIACIFVFLRVILPRTSLVFVVKQCVESIEDWFRVFQFFRVPQFDHNFQENQLYRKISVYVNSLASIEDSDFTNIFSGRKSGEIVLGLHPNQTVRDSFLGARVSWVNEERGDCRSFVLKIRRRDKHRILRPYLQHIHAVSDEIGQGRKELKLYVNTQDHGRHRNGRWMSVPFTHPATLDTIAMDSDLKNRVKSDLESFLKSKQYYHRLGRVWKRSFLLYGPPGTGKSSFIAAMAKFLRYDIYDIDLSKLSRDSDLKTLLLQTTKRCVIVVEDLDRFAVEKSQAVWLSGLLNFMDGIFSTCCGEEKVMVFTMSEKEQIDFSMLRPGRIDAHIHFPLCDFKAFRTLANSYLGLKDHKLFPQVEEIFESGGSLSPAEIGELMIMNRSSPSRALKSVISALQIDGDKRRVSKMGQRLEDDESKQFGDSSDSSVTCRETVPPVREFRKLYGLLKMSIRKSGSFHR